MGFLDSKTTILDFSLTDRGKELLSQNLLNFTYYAFSDDGIDYGAALTASLTIISASVDSYLRRNPALETTSQRDANQQKDLQYFLYTIPSGRKTLPTFSTNFDQTPNITTKRSFYLDKLTLVAKKVSDTQRPLAVVARATKNISSNIDKFTDYTLKQKLVSTTQKIAVGDNIVGLPIANNAIMINSDSVLNTDKGTITNLSQFVDNEKNNLLVDSVSEDVEFVDSISRAKIDFVLKSGEGEFPSLNGYLIEIFESGSDGKITKVVEEDVIDVLGDKVLQRGFEDQLFLGTDLESEDLLSEVEKIQNRQQRQKEIVFQRLQDKINKRIK